MSCERFSTRCCPPADTRATGPIRRDRLLSARVGERPTGMIVRFPQRPEFESLGSGHMVGELAQPRLQSTKGTNAGGDLCRRCRGGKHFQCVPELLRSNSHPVDLAIVAEAVVEVVQKPPDKPSRPPAGVRVDRLGHRRRLDGHEQRGGLLLPTTALHAGDLVLESASRLRPFLRQHLRKPLPGHSSGGGLPGRCRRPATAGEHVEIAGFSGRTANPAERFFEPPALPPWHERLEGGDGGGRTPGGNPQAMHGLRPRVSCGHGGYRPRDGRKPLLEGPAGDDSGRCCMSRSNGSRRHRNITTGFHGRGGRRSGPPHHCTGRTARVPASARRSGSAGADGLWPWLGHSGVRQRTLRNDHVRNEDRPGPHGSLARPEAALDLDFVAR